MTRENRKHARYPILAIGSIHAIKKGFFLPVTTLINNISYSGMGLSSYAPIERDTPVSIEIVKIMGLSNKDKVRGTVVWSHHQKNVHYMGISFDHELHPDKQPVLYEHFFEAIKYF